MLSMELNLTAELDVAMFHSLHGHKPVGKCNIDEYIKLLQLVVILFSHYRFEQTLSFGINPA